MIGWLFTLGYLHLPFWRAVLGLLTWAYFLGGELAGRQGESDRAEIAAAPPSDFSLRQEVALLLRNRCPCFTVSSPSWGEAPPRLNCRSVQSRLRPEVLIVIAARPNGGAVHAAGIALREGRPAFAVKWEEGDLGGNQQVLDENAQALSPGDDLLALLQRT